MARNDDDDGNASAAADIDDEQNRCCFDLYIFTIYVIVFMCTMIAKCAGIHTVCVLKWESHKST